MTARSLSWYGLSPQSDTFDSHFESQFCHGLRERPSDEHNEDSEAPE
jgi:hypothetical protein